MARKHHAINQTELYEFYNPLKEPVQAISSLLQKLDHDDVHSVISSTTVDAVLPT